MNCYFIDSYPQEKVTLRWAKTAPVRMLGNVDSQNSEVEQWEYQECMTDSSAGKIFIYYSPL